MTEPERRRIGQRYELFAALAAGGTSTVHLGLLHGTAGFVKPIAVKRLHPHLAADQALRQILVEEARLVSRISHPNVVAVLDIVEDHGELFLVLEYVHGATVAELIGGEGTRCEPAVAVAIMKDALTGLHAAHHARDASGALLGLVHRDVSPRNVIVSTDGIGKVLDFGIARARARKSSTRDGHVRGSLPYMAPEQLSDEPLSARTDVYGASVVLWEALTGTRLFDGESDAAIIKRILDHDVRAPSTRVPELPQALDAVLLRGLARDPGQRFASGLEMALALEESLAPARPAAVAAWVAARAEKELARRQVLLEAGETTGDAKVVTMSSRTPSTSTAPTAAALAEANTALSRPWRPGALMVAVVVVVGLVAYRVFGDRGTRMREPAASSTSTSASADAGTSTGTSASADTSTSTSTRGEPPVASMAPTGPARAERVAPAASLRPMTGPAPARVVSGAAPPASAPTPAPTASAPPAAKPPCVPYYLDSAGVRRFNRDCLE